MEYFVNLTDNTIDKLGDAISGSEQEINLLKEEIAIKQARIDELEPLATNSFKVARLNISMTDSFVDNTMIVPVISGGVVKTVVMNGSGNLYNGLEQGSNTGTGQITIIPQTGSFSGRTATYSDSDNIITAIASNGDNLRITYDRSKLLEWINKQSLPVGVIPTKSVSVKLA